MKYKNLFTPIKINQTIIKNRIVAAPIGDVFERTGLFLRFMGAEYTCHDSRRCGYFRRDWTGKDIERFYEKD